MTELKRCPFCNSDVDFIKGEHAWYVKCPKCKQESYHFRSPNGKERLAEYWNSRPIEDELNARIKELERQVDEYHKFYWGNGRLNHP